MDIGGCNEPEDSDRSDGAWNCASHLRCHHRTRCEVQLHAGHEFLKVPHLQVDRIEGASHPNQIVDAEIKQAVDAQLSTKGLTKTDDEKADLYVGYQIAVDQEKQWNAYGMGGRWGGGMASATQSTISIGSLVIDMYDPGTKDLVWTGTASKSIDPSSNQQKNQNNLNKAMAKLLKNYPPKK